jgi:alkylhydroperoxidase family enzyme
MARIADGSDSDLVSWMAARPKMAAGMGALSNAVYNASGLPVRVREIARMRIAQDNQCEVCLHTRDAQGDDAGTAPDDDFYTHVAQWQTWPGYSERERIAAEFAERFARDHHGLRDDDAFWSRAREHFDDGEILALGISCSMWLGNGRLMRVLDVAQACTLVLHDTAPSAHQTAHDTAHVTASHDPQ